MKIARALLSAHMKILFSTIIASALIGCGGEIESNAAASDDDAAVVATCDPGQGIQTIGQVPGYVFSIAAAGSNLYAVTGTLDDSGQITSSPGILYGVGANGSRVIDSSIDSFNVASLGSTIGYLSASLTSQGFYVDGAVRMIDVNGAVTTIGDPNNITSDFSSLTTNGNAFMWLETPNGPPSPSKTSTIATSAGSSSTVMSVSNGVLVTSNFVTDGAHLFGAFSTNDVGTVVGQIRVGDAGTTLVLDPTPGAVEAMVGVDDQNLYYIASPLSASLATLWSVPKSGSRPPTALASMQIGTNVVLAKGNAYWLDPQSTQTNVMTMPLSLYDTGDAEQPDQAAYVITSSSDLLTAIGVDDCGILLAENQSMTQSSILRLALQ